MTENSTLIRRIIQVVSGFAAVQYEDPSVSFHRNSRSPSFIQSSIGVSAHRGAPSHPGTRDVLLIPCSGTKDTREGKHHPKRGGIRDGLANPLLIAKVTETRVRIRTLIEMGALEGEEFNEGNRALRPPNKKFYLGPDFGSDVNKARYLPAYERYLGRCYQAGAEDWGRFFALEESQRPDVLIVSGLYGLFPADEYIQNYDVHLTDLDVSQRRTVQSYWHEILTDVLFSRLNWLEQQGHKVGRVFDFLTEDLYRSVFNWPKIYARCTVLHQVFEKRSGRAALDNTGIWLRKVITSPEILNDIEPDRFYGDPEFLHQDRCLFRSRVGDRALDSLK